MSKRENNALISLTDDFTDLQLKEHNLRLLLLRCIFSFKKIILQKHHLAKTPGT